MDIEEQAYLDAVDDVCQAAGLNDGQWNTRFIVELNKRGLRLAVIETGKYEPYYIHAPDPVANEFPTWHNALIVPRT